MTRLAEQLDDAVGPINPTFDAPAIQRRVTRRRRARRQASVALIALVVIGAALAYSALRPNRSPKVRTISPATRVVLRFNSSNGVITYEPGSRRVHHVPISGWRQGDQPFWSLQVGNRLVVGWGDVFAAPMDGGASRRLGTGVFVPAVEPGAVWLTSYGGVQTPTERLVDMRGRVLLEGDAPRQDGTPYSAVALTGVPGGLVFEGKTGLDVWDARSGRFTRHLGTTTGDAAPAFGSLLPWCDHCADALELTDLSSGNTHHVPLALHQESLWMSRAAFSPDGRLLAVPAIGDAAPQVHRSTVLMIDTSDGSVHSRIRVASHLASVAWSPDGRRLYIAGQDQEPGRVLVHDVRRHSTRDAGRVPNGALGLTAGQNP